MDTRERRVSGGKMDIAK